MVTKPDRTDQRSEAETEQIRDAAIKRALNTPPKPRKAPIESAKKESGGPTAKKNRRPKRA